MAQQSNGAAAALNCIVDDSALLAGLSNDTKEDLKQWVRDGAINLFVPLYTLETLNQLRSSPPPTNLNARTTLEWLDDITTTTAGQPVGRVELQGPDDQYKSWKEVEQYLLPDTPLSSGSLDGVAEDTRGRLKIPDNGRKGATALRDESESAEDSFSPHSSPEAGQARLTSQDGSGHSRKTSSNAQQGAGAIPPSVRPLLNFVVWRTYHTDSTIAGSGKYILLTNDRRTQKQASKFGVRAKLLPQLIPIVAKITPAIVPNGINMNVDRPIEPGEAPDEADEDEVVFNPAQRPGSSREKNIVGTRGATSTGPIIDPDHFGRNLAAAPAMSSKPLPIQSFGLHTSNKSSPRGQHHQGFPRDGKGPVRGGASPPSYRGGRGRGGSLRNNPHVNGRGGFRPGDITPAQQQNTKPIDPDSYARPHSTRGRGNAMRRLWNPNT